MAVVSRYRSLTLSRSVSHLPVQFPPIEFHRQSHTLAIKMESGTIPLKLADRSNDGEQVERGNVAFADLLSILLPFLVIDVCSIHRKRIEKNIYRDVRVEADAAR